MVSLLRSFGEIFLRAGMKTLFVKLLAHRAGLAGCSPGQ